MTQHRIEVYFVIFAGSPEIQLSHLWADSTIFVGMVAGNFVCEFPIYVYEVRLVIGQCGMESYLIGRNAHQNGVMGAFFKNCCTKNCRNCLI